MAKLTRLHRSSTGRFWIEAKEVDNGRVILTWYEIHGHVNRVGIGTSALYELYEVIGEALKCGDISIGGEDTSPDIPF